MRATKLAFFLLLLTTAAWADPQAKDIKTQAFNGNLAGATNVQDGLNLADNLNVTGASSTASYVTTQAEAGLSAETNLGALTSGILKHTVAGSVSTPATAVAGTDYVAPNGAITGATKTKVTYDTKGLVTAGADATTADIADSSDKRYVTDAQLVVLGNTSGTNTGDQDLSGKQNLDAELTALAGLTSAADKGIQFTGSGTAATYDLTAAGKALLDDVDAAAQRSTLGLGTMAVETAANYPTLAGSNTFAGANSFPTAQLSLRGAISGTIQFRAASSNANGVWSYPNFGSTLSPTQVLGADSAQTVTNKTIDGDDNTILDIDDDEVNFDDGDSNFAATTVGGALEELDDVNGSGVNAADGKVHWTQLLGVPAGFADGTDDGGGGGGGSADGAAGAVQFSDGAAGFVGDETKFFFNEYDSSTFIKPDSFDFVFRYDGTTFPDGNVSDLAGSRFIDDYTNFFFDYEDVSDDIFYIGNSSPFNSFYVSVPASYSFDEFTLLWEYWDGDSWETLTVTDATSNLTESGIISFTVPGDWSTTSVNSESAYFIRVSTLGTDTNAIVNDVPYWNEIIPLNSDGSTDVLRVWAGGGETNPAFAFGRDGVLKVYSPEGYYNMGSETSIVKVRANTTGSTFRELASIDYYVANSGNGFHDSAIILKTSSQHQQDGEPLDSTFEVGHNGWFMITNNMNRVDAGNAYQQVGGQPILMQNAYGTMTIFPRVPQNVQQWTGSGFVNITAEASTIEGTPFEILSAENPSDDYLYVGNSATARFLLFDIDTPGEGVTLVVEYWNGSAWTAISGGGFSDGTSNLSQSGLIDLSTVPNDWALKEENGQVQYWLRLSSSTEVTVAPTAFSVYNRYDNLMFDVRSSYYDGHSILKAYTGGDVYIRKSLQIGRDGQDGSLVVYSEQGGTDYTSTFQPGTQTQNITYTLPNDDGDADQVLATNGSGVLAWVTSSGGGLTSADIDTANELAAIMTDETGSGGGFVRATSPQISAIELGAASDTTIARSGAGAVTVEGVQVILSGAALGTPASGTLTNCAGLPVAGITASTSTAIGVGSVELGAASDTTLARNAAGVLQVEGVVVPTISSTNTLTNKRLTPRVVTAADATSITPNSDNADITYQLNTQAGGTLTINADGGAPTNGQKWMLKVKCTNAQNYSWNSQYVSGSDVTLPTTTLAGKVDNVFFIWDGVASRWECVGVARGY